MSVQEAIRSGRAFRNPMSPLERNHHWMNYTKHQGIHHIEPALRGDSFLEFGVEDILADTWEVAP